jgi:type IV secretion system pilin
MKRLRNIFISSALLIGFIAMIIPTTPAAAINVFGQCGSHSSTKVCQSSGDDAADMIKIVINTMLGILGMIAVIMIIVGGIRYTTSYADASKLKNARDTIIYAVVGLVVAIMSFAIVNFVLGRFS